MMIIEQRESQAKTAGARSSDMNELRRASHGGFSKSKGKNDAELLPATTTAKLGPVIELRLVISTGMGKCWVH